MICSIRADNQFTLARELINKSLANREIEMDYLKKYVSEEGFDVPRMLNDDFFLAIKTLLKAGYFISAAKLLVSFIDTMAYLEYGDGGGPAFKKWVSSYVDLGSLGITDEELWEHRNSLLHMSTLSSRKVSVGKVRRLVAYVGQLPSGSPSEDLEAKWFDLLWLIQAVAKGLELYIVSINEDSANWVLFCERYDQVLSDTRIVKINVSTDS